MAGHFCARRAADGECASPTGQLCPEALDGVAGGACPLTCHDCPGWSEREHASLMFSVVLAMTLSTPLLLHLFLPFLEGRRRAPCEDPGTEEALAGERETHAPGERTPQAPARRTASGRVPLGLF